MKKNEIIEEFKWGNNSYIFELNKKLKKIEIPERLNAIYHKKDGLLEFIFSPVNKADKYTDRKFEFNYSNLEFVAYYDEPSKVFVDLAKGFKSIKKDEGFLYNNLYTSFRQFRDYYTLNKKSENFLKNYFKDKVPLNFFIKGSLDEINNFESLSKHLNFYMHYYDRRSPIIIINEEDEVVKNNKKFKESCLSFDKKFPEKISIKLMDPILMEIFSVALTTGSPMLKYLFYYQILEYCSYYYITETMKQKMKKILKNPDYVEKTNDAVKFIIEESRNFVNENGDQMTKIITDFCEFSDIKLEIEDNWNYFSNDVEFEGGFTLPAIINGEADSKTPPKNIMNSIVGNVGKIRNVLVHLREKRENKTILPTKKNHNLLKPYLFLIRRIAEKIAIQHE